MSDDGLEELVDFVGGGYFVGNGHEIGSQLSAVSVQLNSAWLGESSLASAMLVAKKQNLRG
jgi:hypothetical protein